MEKKNKENRREAKKDGTQKAKKKKYREWKKKTTMKICVDSPDLTREKKNKRK